MPIFQDPDRQTKSAFQSRSHDQASCALKHSPDTPLAESFDGMQDEVMAGTSAQNSSMETQNRPTLHTSNREELIRSIKRGESPTWVPNRSVSDPRYMAVYSSLHPSASLKASFMFQRGDENIDPGYRFPYHRSLWMLQDSLGARYLRLNLAEWC